jgi:hypothetical protein
MTEVISKAALSATTPDTAVFDLPSELTAKFDRLSEAKYARLELEKEEKRIKKEICALLPERVKGIKYVLRVGGVIRASVTLGHRTTVKGEDLLAAFPEAYEALAQTAYFDTVNPA